MIWSITSKEEMENYGISSVFKYYREALGKDNVKLAVVDENDKLDFLQKEDVALLRTASESLIKTIRAKGVKTTAEDFSKYELVRIRKRSSVSFVVAVLEHRNNIIYHHYKKVRHILLNLDMEVIVLVYRRKASVVPQKR